MSGGHPVPVLSRMLLAAPSLAMHCVSNTRFSEAISLVAASCEFIESVMIVRFRPKSHGMPSAAGSSVTKGTFALLAWVGRPSLVLTDACGAFARRSFESLELQRLSRQVGLRVHVLVAALVG